MVNKEFVSHKMFNQSIKYHELILQHISHLSYFKIFVAHAASIRLRKGKVHFRYSLNLLWNSFENVKYGNRKYRGHCSLFCFGVYLSRIVPYFRSKMESELMYELY